MSKPTIRYERVYADPEGTTGGFRVLVDRLWPRGESKQKFHYDLWAKDVTPSTQLREWYHDDREDRWPEFEKRYEQELAANPAMLAFLDTLRKHSDIVLLTGAKDVAHSHVPVLMSYLSHQMSLTESTLKSPSHRA